MKGYLNKSTSAAPLAVFRFSLGIIIFISIVRFWAKGWIDDLYIKPVFYFPFYGFEFIKPLGPYTYLIFLICGISALLVAVGLFYRVAIISLFASFTYIELIDKSTYLNHYYFISAMCFLFIFLPANAYFSIDSFRNKKILSDKVPGWCLDSIKLLVGILYFFAGLAKLNSDWLFKALPLKIWLPAHNDLPIIGPLFNYIETAFLFSWFGCIYDLSIPFLLWNRFTRPFGYTTVIVFHLFTAMLFPIGMFPYFMIITAVIFFSDNFHQNIINRAGSFLNLTSDTLRPNKTFAYSTTRQSLIVSILVIFFAVQTVFPFRYLLYPGELFWTEEGYRFSWRVMLMEKAGHAQFTVKDGTGKKIVVDNKEFLTTLQEKMMSTQPDMILQYAHKLRDYYESQGFKRPQVYVDSYVSLNGRLGSPLIDPMVDLAKEKESFNHKSWIIPFNDEIKGL